MSRDMMCQGNVWWWLTTPPCCTPPCCLLCPTHRPTLATRWRQLKDAGRQLAAAAPSVAATLAAVKVQVAADLERVGVREGRLTSASQPSLGECHLLQYIVPSH